MKVGILTFHRAYNYGAILQAYALQKKLEEQGVESEVIDYLSKGKREQYKLFTYNKTLGLKRNLSKLVKDCYRKKKNAAFDQFMTEEMHISSQNYATFEELVQMNQSEGYDMYIVGSDQVWNPQNNCGDSAFLLTFVSDDQKKCSYAASIGSAEFDEEMNALYEREISKFRVLSVREQSSVSEYAFLNQNGAKAVVDPTLLLSKKAYEAIANPRVPMKKYAFLYTIPEDRNLRRYAHKYCQENGLILVDCKKSMIFFQHASPRDFLSFIQYAECIFTNSFHGTALSIMMEKQFITELHPRCGVNNRSKDLLCKLSLLDRDIDSDKFNPMDRIDYSRVNTILADLRSDSVDVLKQIVGK